MSSLFIYMYKMKTINSIVTNISHVWLVFRICHWSIDHSQNRKKKPTKQISIKYKLSQDRFLH